MKTRAVFLAILTALSITTAIARAQGVSPQADQLWQQARQMTYSQAYPLLLQAAQLGHPKAQATLGTIYSKGMAGVPQNYAAAAYWYQKSAAQGNRSAQYNLGGMYVDGVGGLPVDYRKAVQLFAASAQQGFAPAQAELGICLELGQGVTRNRQAAISWLDKAAAQGDQSAALMARVLTHPNTPQFSNETQFANYLNAQQSAPAGGQGGRVYRCVPNSRWTWNGSNPSQPMGFCGWH